MPIDDVRREFDSVREYGYVIWVIQPPYEVGMNMISELKARIEEVRDEGIRMYLLSQMTLKLFMGVDAYGIHWLSIEHMRHRNEPKITWHVLLDEYRHSREYRSIRAYTTGNELLSYYSGFHFIKTISKELMSLMRESPELKELARLGLKNLNEYAQKYGGKPSNRPSVRSLLMAPSSALDSSTRQLITNLARATAGSVLDAVSALAEYLNNLNQLKARHQAIHAKGLEEPGILLERPEELRRRARILANITKLVDELRTTIVEGGTSEFGYPVGYGLGTRPFDTAMKEFMIPEPLRSLRLLTMHYSLERASGRRFNIIIDRSGSMGEEMPGGIEKVSLATALAISMIMKYGSVNVYAFDIGLHEIGSGGLAIEPLLELAPDGGTSLKTALEFALNATDDSIIITDAIDPDVPMELARKALDRARLVILEPAEYEDWVREFVRSGRAIIAKKPSDIVEFLKAPGITGSL